MTPSAISPAGPGPASSAINLLASFGWSSTRWGGLLEQHPSTCEPGRVVAASRGLALVQTVTGECWCAPTGRFRQYLLEAELSLCAGDWVVLQANSGTSKASTLDLLPRKSSLTRQCSGPGHRQQCLAANLDVVFLVMGLDRNFNPSRMERLLALAWGSGAQPVVALTKRDLCQGYEAFVARIEGIAPGVPVLAVSALAGEGLADLQSHLGPGRTGALIGSSGAGKSTLLNALMDAELRRTQEVRAVDGRGRHTTSLRELFLLPQGGCLIDTPGLREVGLSVEGSDLDSTFSDLTALATNCRYRDCTHGAEPGCAVQAALAQGILDPDRYGHYLRLRREVAFEAARSDERLWREREAKWHRISKLQKQFKKR